MKCGLVLEGGGLRGLFTAGVLDVFMERGVKYDGLVGVSAGACFGCNDQSGQSGRVIRYNKRFARDPRYCSWSSLIRTGDLFNADFCYRELPMELDVFDAEAYAALLIAPAAPLEISRVCHDPGQMQRTYEVGRRRAEKAFQQLVQITARRFEHKEIFPCYGG